MALEAVIRFCVLCGYCERGPSFDMGMKQPRLRPPDNISFFPLQLTNWRLVRFPVKSIIGSISDFLCCFAPLGSTDLLKRYG